MNMKATRNTPAQKQTIQIGYSDFGADTSAIQPPAESDTYAATEVAVTQLDIK